MSPIASILCSAILAAFPLSALAGETLPAFSDSFDSGIRPWTTESGQAGRGKEKGGTLMLRSVREPDGTPRPGIAVRIVTGLEPNRNYELKVDFRFEKDFEDRWPWAKVEIVESVSGNTSAPPLTSTRIATQKQSGAIDADSAWRTVTLPFNPGDASSVVIRLSNHPKMYDQTHWDNLRIVPLEP
ncbi:hypothetical protein OPIT5_15640 [Opitutaceae bacterium TAV5]|nr:hypothetical protein OPIT5_15640 [Opitutaceae bacterium TAV5]